VTVVSAKLLNVDRVSFVPDSEPFVLANTSALNLLRVQFHLTCCIGHRA